MDNILKDKLEASNDLLFITTAYAYIFDLSRIKFQLDII